MPPIAVRRATRMTLLALAAIALTPAATSAAPPPDYVGANAQAMVKLRVVAPDRWDQFASRMAADGLRVVRLDAAWAWAEPSAPANGVHSYTWDRANQSLDAIVALFARRGVRVLPAFTTTPGWARASGTDLAPERFGDFAAFAGAFAARYGSNGSYWAAHPEIPKTPVQEYQVWSEANSTMFWTHAPNPSQYLDALRLVAPALRKADPAGQVLISIGWQDFESYVNALYDGGLKGLVDGVGFQPYAPYASAIIDLVRRMSVLTRARGDGSLPLYITELGQPAVASGGAATAQSGGIVSDAARAATHSLAADALARSDCNVRDYLIYDLVSSENQAKDGYEALMGSYRLADAQPNATGRALGDVAARWRARPTSGIALCRGGATPFAALRPLETAVSATGAGCTKASVKYRGNPLEGALLRIATNHVVAGDASDAFGDASACAQGVTQWTVYVEIPNVARSATYSCKAGGCTQTAPAPPGDDPLPGTSPPPCACAAPPATAPAPGGTAGTVRLGATSTTPAKRVDAATKRAVYSLKLRSGARPARFSVRLAPPPFATRGPFDEGRSLGGPTAIALRGPGTLGQRRQDPAAKPCSARVHGYATGATTIDVALPANAKTTLTARYATGRRAPWIDGDYRLTFQVLPALVGSYMPDSPLAGGPTGVTPATVRTAGPKPGGRTGVRLVLTTARRGTRVTISGRMLPARRKRAVVVEWSRPGGRRHTLARVRTDGRGRFRVRSWRAPAAGTYELWARYPAQRGGLAADATSCPVMFTRA